MANDLFGDVQAPLQLQDGVRRRVEQQDVVRALAVLADWIGQPAPAPRAALDDLAAGCGHGAGGPVDDRVDLLVRRIRAHDEHELITSHVSRYLLPLGNRPARLAGRLSAELKGGPRSIASGHRSGRARSWERARLLDSGPIPAAHPATTGGRN